MFKEKLKENRQKLGYTQEQLAREIFVSREAVSKWEQGRGLPEKESLSHLAALFKMNESDLLTEEDLHEAVDENADDAEKSRHRFFALSLVSSILVTALASALIAFAFIYHSTSKVSEGYFTLESVTMKKDEKDESVIGSLEAKGEEGKVLLEASAFEKTIFYDEEGALIGSPWTLYLTLREGDYFWMEKETSQEKNLYGREQNVKNEVRSFHMVHHLFTKEKLFYGVGLSIGDDWSFAENTKNCGYFFHDVDTSNGRHVVSSGSHFAGDVSLNFAYSNAPERWKITTKMTFFIESSVFDTQKYSLFFKNGAESWESHYWNLAKDESVSADTLVPFTLSGSTRETLFFKGASDLMRNDSYYEFDSWFVTIQRRVVSDHYSVSFYDEKAALLGQSDIHSLTEASSLKLPEARSYALIHEIDGNGNVLSMATVYKENTFPFYFPNGSGLFDSKTVTL